MSRISGVFAALRAAGRKAFIPYITAGDPDPETTLAVLDALVENGADIIELGIPFSDPMADGPVIQLACERALARGMTLTGVLEIAQQFRARHADTPLVLMGYLNPLERMGYAKFAERAAAAGVDGVLVVDMPPEEAPDLRRELSERSLDLVFLLAPTTTDERARRIAGQASGYLYYVSLRGVTGAGNLQVDEVAARLDGLRRLTDLPIGVGFGISDADSARAVAAVSDGVVIGSALVQRIADSVDAGESPAMVIGEFAHGVRAALDGPGGDA